MGSLIAIEIKVVAFAAQEKQTGTIAKTYWTVSRGRTKVGQ